MSIHFRQLVFSLYLEVRKVWFPASLPTSKSEISVKSLPAWPLRNLLVLGFEIEVAVTMSTWEDFAKCPLSETPRKVGNVLGS